MNLFPLRTILIVGAICLAYGCAAPAPTVRSQPPVLDSRPQSAEELLDAALSQSGQAAQRLMLQAAARFHEEGRLIESQNTLARIDPAQLLRSEYSQYATLALLIALNNEDMDAVERWLPEADLDPQLAAEVRAKVCALAEQFACAAEEAMRAAAWLTQPELSNETVWSYLVAAANRQQRLGVATQVSQGWWALIEITSSAQSIAGQQQQYQRWRRLNPDHPANRQLPTGLQYLVEPWDPPQRIAALLPLSGQLEAAGKAVRDGLIAAHLNDSNPGKPSLRFFDTNAGDIHTTFEKAVASGAELLIGPLLKSNAAALAQVPAEVPILALNRVEEVPVSDTFYQFALAIEDEANTVAKRLQADGHTRVLAVVSENAPWAQRAFSVLAQQDLELLETAPATDATQMTEAIGSAMLVSKSSQRHLQMQQIIGEPLEFNPRGRRDLHAVVAFVDGVQARTLAPALRYHFADDLAVYTGAQALRGNSSLRSLEGFHITDLPLLIHPDGISAQLTQAFALTSESTSSLYGLGADAYVVADRAKIMRGAGSSVRGATGLLKIDAANRITREQSWAIVHDGQILADTRNRELR